MPSVDRFRMRLRPAGFRPAEEAAKMLSAAREALLDASVAADAEALRSAAYGSPDAAAPLGDAVAKAPPPEELVLRGLAAAAVHAGLIATVDDPHWARLSVRVAAQALCDAMGEGLVSMAEADHSVVLTFELAPGLARGDSQATLLMLVGAPERAADSGAAAGERRRQLYDSLWAEMDAIYAEGVGSEVLAELRQVMAPVLGGIADPPEEWQLQDVRAAGARLLEDGPALPVDRLGAVDRCVLRLARRLADGDVSAVREAVACARVHAAEVTSRERVALKALEARELVKASVRACAEFALLAVATDAEKWDPMSLQEAAAELSRLGASAARYAHSAHMRLVFALAPRLAEGDAEAIDAVLRSLGESGDGHAHKGRLLWRVARNLVLGKEDPVPSVADVGSERLAKGTMLDLVCMKRVRPSLARQLAIARARRLRNLQEMTAGMGTSETEDWCGAICDEDPVLASTLCLCKAISEGCADDARELIEQAGVEQLLGEQLDAMFATEGMGAGSKLRSAVRRVLARQIGLVEGLVDSASLACTSSSRWVPRVA